MTPISRPARWLAWATSLLYLLFPLMFVLGIADLAITPVAQAALGMALLGAVLTAGVLVAAGLVWRWRWWSLGGRLHYSLVALASSGRCRGAEVLEPARVRLVSPSRAYGTTRSRWPRLCTGAYRDVHASESN